MKELRMDINSNADYFRKELENTRRSQEKLENSFAEMKIVLKTLKSRMNNAEEWISDLEDRIMEITQLGQKTENQMKKHGNNIRDLWDNIKVPTMHNRDSKRRRKRKGDWKYIWRNYGWELSTSKGYWYQDTGCTEGPKHVEPKQTHTKTYYNKNGKS